MAYFKILEKVVSFTNKYDNVLSFKSLYDNQGNKVVDSITKEDFFKGYDKNYNMLQYYTKKNFKYGDTISTSIIVSPEEFGYSNAINGANYVHVINEENTKYPRDLFYFITDLDYRNGKTIELSLELDIFTTYFDKTKLTRNDNDLFTTRCHCDRFTINGYNQFGCEEALLGDRIDGQFNANIIKNRYVVDEKEKLYLLIYTSYNAKHGSGYYEQSSKPWLVDVDANVVNYRVTLNKLPLPYVVGILPVDEEVLTIKNNLETEEDISINYGLYAKGSGSIDYLKYIYDNVSYILSIQVVSSSSTMLPSELTINRTETDNTYGMISLTLDNRGTAYPIFYNSNIDALVDDKKINYKVLFNLNLNKDLSFNRNDLNNITNKEIALEPKLYTAPYSYYSYTSPIFQDDTFEPILALKDEEEVTLRSVWSPNPSTSGERLIINSGYYKFNQDSYVGNTPVITSEVPVITSAYQDFLATQKNSFYTGLALSMFSGAFDTALPFTHSENYDKRYKRPTLKSTKARGLTEGLVEGAGGLLSQGFETYSKIKDLKMTPNKFNSNNFDVFGVLSSTNLNKTILVKGLTDYETQKVYDFYYLNGYQVEMFRDLKYQGTDIKSDYNSLFTRRLFDYIELGEDITEQINYVNEDKEEMVLPFSVRDLFNKIFRTGVRIWFSATGKDYLDFSLENKEINDGKESPKEQLLLPQLSSLEGSYTYKEIEKLKLPQLSSVEGSYTYKAIGGNLKLPQLSSLEGSYTYSSIEPVIPTLLRPQLSSLGGSYTYENIDPPITKLSKPQLSSVEGSYTYKSL